VENVHLSTGAPGSTVKTSSPFSNIAAAWLVSLVSLAVSASARQVAAGDQADVVTYEAFGAVGDGVADDLPAIVKAHAHANKHGLRVRSKPDATYHLGRQALTAIITADTDWGTSRFIIDDSQGVDDHRRSLFEVRSLLKPLPLRVDRLARGQQRLDLQPGIDCLVYVENKNQKVFIRRGLNRTDGTAQKEVFILRRDGSITGGIDWDYDVVTRVEARPIDLEPLFLRGGVFINIANRMKREKGSSYWGRNILINRSRTVVDGVINRVTGEADFGQPYGGFLSVQQCASVMLRNCVIDGRKTYQKIGNAGKSVSMGTYGYHGNLVVDFRMINCRNGNDIHDRSRWGVVATNFMKDILIEDCVLSRVDVHQGVSGSYIIRRSTLGHAGLNAIGRGRLLVEDSTLHGSHLIRFRDDYGSTWDGEVLIRNSRWIPPAGRSQSPAIFGMVNDGMHDFGYPCFMPRVIRIEGLFIEDSNPSRDYRGVCFFSDPFGAPSGKRPFPYRLTERLEHSRVETASGLPIHVCTNPEVTKAVHVVSKSKGASAASQGAGTNH
jgi:hypothetical protein